MKTIVKGINNGLTISQSFKLLLKNSGYYAFNRFMVKYGFPIGYTLYIHRIKF